MRRDYLTHTRVELGELKELSTTQPHEQRYSQPDGNQFHCWACAGARLNSWCGPDRAAFLALADQVRCAAPDHRQGMQAGPDVAGDRNARPDT